MPRRALYTVFRGYIDDSSHKDIFTMACLVAKPPIWGWISIDWMSCLDKKNLQLKAEGRPQISCYHATDSSNRYREFKGWTIEEVAEFTKELISIFNKPSSEGLAVFAVSVNLTELESAFPEATPDRVAFASVLMLHCIMLEISDAVISTNGLADLDGIKIALVHERGNYNGTLQRAFETTKTMSASCRKLFATLVPMGWEDCIQLQPADLLAYEECKEKERDPTLRNMRRSLTAIRSATAFGGVSKYFYPEGLAQLRQFMTEEIKQQFLLDANLAKSNHG